MSDQPEQPTGSFQPLEPDSAAAQPDVRYGAPAPKRKRNPLVIWLSVLAAVLVIALVVVIGLLVVGQGGTPAADATGTPTVTATAEPTPAPTATDAAVTPAAPVRPTDCTQLFPAGYIDSVTEGGILELNPAWAQPDLATEFIGSNDNALVAVISANTDRLNCILAKSSGGGDLGITTNVLVVDAATQTAAIARMNEAGFTCSEETGGTMCFTETTEDAGTYGERHFLRDGTWIATRWSNTSITGWTQTIVSTLFPA
jgi:hypothetical protein